MISRKQTSPLEADDGTTASPVKVLRYTGHPWQTVVKDIHAHIQRICMQHEACTGKSSMTFTEATFAQLRDMFDEISPYKPEVIHDAFIDLVGCHLLERVGVGANSRLRILQRTNKDSSIIDANRVLTRKMRVQDVESFILAYVCDDHHFDAKTLHGFINDKMVYSEQEIASVLKELATQPNGIIVELYQSNWYMMRSEE
jgi:hypothetical protein